VDDSEILRGRAAVVTGGGRGIGRGHCLQLARAGAAVVVNDVDADEAAKVALEIESGGGRAAVSGADVGSRKGCEELVEQCVASFGQIDALVANAGIMRDRSFLKMTDEEFDAVWNVHVKGTFWCAQAAAARMREQGSGGSLVLTTSAAHMGNFGQTNYAAAKGAIASITYTLALELAAYGIRVNAISPAGTTRMSATFKGPDGKPVEMPFLDPTQNGVMVAFLCSDDAAFVTGQVFGTGADRLMLLSQPRYGFGLVKAGGFSLADLRQQFKAHFGNRLEPLGIQKAPYPFYDGVKPRG
jgi:3-oxoacyl-[acyl-carrier protein] reductase